MHYFFDALKKYAVFGGRSSRREYFMFFLISFVIAFALSFILGIIKAVSNIDIMFIGGIYQNALLVPSLALAIRRIHDTDKSGWFVLVPFYNVVLLFISGTPGTNRFGTDPKEGKVD